MLSKIRSFIQSKLVKTDEKTRRRRWLLPLAALASILILSSLALYITGAAIKTYTIWPQSAKPKVVNQHDSHPVELGLKFRSKTSGQVTGVKFYKSNQNVGTHIGNLWDKRGNKLATVTFKNETKSGWQVAKFEKPVTIAADTTYVISYFAPKGHFSIDSRYFAKSARTSGPLTALKSGTDGVNGVYSYGFKSSFPSDDSNKDNYWVDVIFSANSADPVVETPKSIKAFDSAYTITDSAWFTKAYADGLRLYVANVTDWGTCNPSAQSQLQIKAALAAGLKVAAYTRNPSCWENGIKAVGDYKDKLQFFALDVELSGKPVTREMVNGIKAQGIRPIIYTSAVTWSDVQGASANDFTDLPLWDISTASINYSDWKADYTSPKPVIHSGWNTPGNMRVGVQQQFDYLLNGVSINLNSFDATFIVENPTKPTTPVTPTPPTAPTPATPPASSPTQGRNYPVHTKINATTFWVGEQFQSTADGSQVCSAYDSQWQYSYFRLKTGTNTTVGCKGAPTGGCDALRKNDSGKCDESNSIGSLRTAANGYFPAGLPQIYENPFYLDLPYDDYNLSDKTDTTGFATRCKDIPWANDAGYAGNCTNQAFSYMKNRFVKITANGNTCYGQIEDAGPADDGNGNGNYADAPYVFGTNDARPYNKSYNAAGMDVSPALNACLGGKFNQDLLVNWQFVDDVAVPAGPWKTIVTTTKPN